MYACFFVQVTDCSRVHIGCPPQLRSRSPAVPRHFPCLFTCYVCWPVTRSHVTSAVHTRAWFVRHLHVRLSWTKIDNTVSLGETPSSKLAQCDFRHIVTLTNDTRSTSSSSHDCYDDWRRPSPTDRRQQSVSSVSSTAQLPWRVCCSAPAVWR